MTLASAWQSRANWNWNLLFELASSSVRRTLRMTSGLILFTYIGAHLTNHALGLISLDTAERGMEIAVEIWYSVPGTLLLYGAAATHFLLPPGWLHGCLGLNFAFKRRPLFRQLRFVLFAVALLLPVFSALGFIAMGRELSTNPVAAAAAQE